MRTKKLKPSAQLKPIFNVEEKLQKIMNGKISVKNSITNLKRRIPYVKGEHYKPKKVQEN